MSSRRLAPSLGLLVLFIASDAPAQAPAPPAGRTTAPASRGSTADVEKRAEELDKAIEAAAKADRWDEAIARAEELLDLADEGPGPEALGDGEREVAPRDGSPGGLDTARGSCRLHE